MRDIRGEKNPFYGRTHSPETIQKIVTHPNYLRTRGHRKGKKLSEETKEKIRQTMLKNPTKYWLGKKRSEETRRKISEARKGRYKGADNQNWKGGRAKSGGYIWIFIPEHQKANPRGYVSEHRLVVEKCLGRRLKSDELVHHINGVTNDNRPENLTIVSPAEHFELHVREKE